MRLRFGYDAGCDFLYMPINRINDHDSNLAIRTGKGTSAHPELVEPEAAEGQRLGIPELTMRLMAMASLGVK